MRLAIIAALALLAPVAPAFAVDNSISAYCGAEYADSGYQRPGGYCSQVASNKSLLVGKSPAPCPAGLVRVDDDCVCAS